MFVGFNLSVKCISNICYMKFKELSINCDQIFTLFSKILVMLSDKTVAGSPGDRKISFALQNTEQHVESTRSSVSTISQGEPDDRG